MTRSKLTSAVAVVGLSIGCASLGAHRSHKEYLTAKERLAAIQRAQVWTPTRVEAMDLRTGPSGRGAFAPGETVTCDYVDKRLGGSTPKFACAVTPDDVVKVKYGKDNGEVYAGVAATRLLWALGFGADAMYPVHVICRGCPESLLPGNQAASKESRFDVAAIERKMRGHEMETRDGSGWAWPEIDQVDPGAGGAPRAQVDALKLLAVLLQHSDSKAEQQRLLCEGDGKHRGDLAVCPEPFMMIHDVGQTFGTANLFNRQAAGSVNLTAWADTPIWKDAKRCVGNLAESETGTLTNPMISEAGRKFLADLLMALKDSQLNDLFDVARFTNRPAPDGHETTVADWVSAFQKKRKEIASATCPS